MRINYGLLCRIEARIALHDRWEDMNDFGNSIESGQGQTHIQPEEVTLAVVFCQSPRYLPIGLGASSSIQARIAEFGDRIRVRASRRLPHSRIYDWTQVRHRMQGSN